MTSNTKAATQDRAREQFYRRIDKYKLTPLWEVLGTLVPNSPRPKQVPAHWHRQ